MFVRKLRVLLNVHERLLYSRLYSAGLVSKVNLNHPYNNYLKSIHKNLPHNNSQFIISRNLSNLSETLQRDNEEDNNNDSKNDDYDKPSFSENLFAYSVLLNNKKLESTIMPRLIPDEDITDCMIDKILNKNYEDTCSKEILDDFKTLSLYPKRENLLITDKKFEKILLILKTYVQSYTNEEMKDIFRCLELWQTTHRIKFDKNNPIPYFQLLMELDNDCFLRLNDFKNEDYLTLCDLFWRIRYLKAAFIKKAVKKLGRQVKQLKPEHYLQYLFIINVSRRAFKNMYELEYALELFIPAYSAEELGVICMGFFKTETRLYNPSLRIKIIRKFIEEIDSVRDIAICTLFKIVRLSLGVDEDNTMKDLLNAFRPKIQNVSGICLVHIAHAVSALHFYDKRFMDEIVERFQEFVPTSRAKDLERILFSLVTYKYPKEHPIFEQIVNEFRNPQRAKELANHPVCLGASLMFLSQAEIYPLDLISKVLDHEYLTKYYKMNPYKIGREYLTFSTGVQIEVPEYDGPLLPEKVARYLNKKYSTDPPDLDPDMNVRISQASRFLLEVVNHLRDILGASSFFTDQLLPHYSKQDIIFCLDKNKNFVSPKPHFPQAGQIGVIKYAPTDPDEHTWLVLLLAPRNTIFNKYSITTGLFDAKMRQLKKIGYQPIPLLATKWMSIVSVEDRKNYLRSLLFANHVNNTTSIKSS
ncbi:FAST kinase domain-containing protein 5, mitochondrial [Chelonus insularis]|uniref:FAST kinase domain-containing protein 5, mitochondrial n=1 Tax=Chelonus insularis TaxID=460826 RepID=UPI00158E622A|nr:FAST kinase domain-containing protein 5, mitochondrial [Chelonus insularis]